MRQRQNMMRIMWENRLFCIHCRELKALNVKIIVEQDYLNTSVMIADNGVGIFEKFEEVIIDFDGVQWMGQGFAHQLSVVLQKSTLI